MQWVKPFGDEQARALVNLRARYAALIEAERVLAGLPYNLVSKTVDGRAYLYQVIDRGNNAKSLGPMTAENAARLEGYRAEKADWKARRETARALVAESGRLARALRLPLLSSAAGALLRELDVRGLLDGTLLVVGTNCLPAYGVEAAGVIRDVPDETEDFDLAWVAESAARGALLWQALKAVDSSFAVNAERPFQARNAQAYEVELLVAPSRAATMAGRERPRPVPLPEQEWLLPGRWADQVVPCRDGSAARLVVPDPRWFALHKLWLADKPTRDPLKKRKDRRQGLALLGAVAEAMPHYPIDAAFREGLPEELRPCLAAWEAGR